MSRRIRQQAVIHPRPLTGRRLVLVGVACAATVCLIDLCLSSNRQTAVGQERTSTADRPLTTQSSHLSSNAELARGAQSCSNAACHGSLKPVKRPGSIRFDEYHVWSEDPHRRATQTLENELSHRIYRQLGLLDEQGRIIPGAQDRFSSHLENCRSCHDVAAQTTHPTRTRWLSEGVSCEACHGASTHWLHTHYRQDHLAHAQQMRQSNRETTHPGMRNLNKIHVQADSCVGCHVGGRGHVNHDLIAAGHPAMKFEFSWYRARMPRHWNDARDELAEAQPDAATIWLIGQLAAARASIVQLRHRAQLPANQRFSSTWPEFAEYGCFACHHDLEGEDSWRQQTGFVWSTPSDSTASKVLLPWAPWELQLMDELAAVDGRPEARQVRELFAELTREMESGFLPDREQVVTICDQLIPQITAWSNQVQLSQTQPVSTILRAMLQQQPEEWEVSNWETAAQLFLGLAADYRTAPESAPAELVRVGDLLRFPHRSDGHYDSPYDFRGSTQHDEQLPTSRRKQIARLFQQLLTPAQ